MNNLTITTNLSAYINNIANIPMLSLEEELELGKRVFCSNDLEAAEKLIMANLRFVIYIAKKYIGYGLPLEDLIQEGNIGLMKAVHKFDPNKEVKLMTFAGYHIKAEIHEYVIKNWKIGKIATTKPQRKLFFNLRKMKETTNHSSEKEREAIAKELNVPMRDLREMEERLYSSNISFNSHSDNEDDDMYSPEAFLHAAGDNPEEIFENSEYQAFVKGKIMDVIDDLSDRDRDIILSRKFSDVPLTLEELSSRYGVSFQRIKQLEENIIKKLENAVKEI